MFCRYLVIVLDLSAPILLHCSCWLFLTVVFPALCKMDLYCGLVFTHILDVFLREYRPCVEVPPITYFAHVYCTGIDAAKCRHLMAFSLPFTCCKWLLWCVGLSRRCRGTLNKPVINSLVPCNSTCSSLVTAMVCLLKLASQL